ncbi:DUF1194 domain-containing protein [Aureimonas pseudogalii]|uniref:DUF1194 domain-containing protein n=1 Tax=Aureimonas pseudogalii TaxID=1744844 RepID=A0A7W6EHE7_9HYPH|nr:DUF1194 domain-containing protein [Aureimonas pseudogalii]MBB3998189.1 hypothetical protein [Aureimonas pseudogalii]
MRTVPALLAACLAFWLPPSVGKAQAAEMPVDVELVLAVDVSWSMDRAEQEIQRDGYIAALRSPEVQKAIADGIHGKVALTYVEWAGELSQAVVIPWTLVDGKEAAESFAYRLSNAEPDRLRRTSIAAAIDFVAPMFENNGFEGIRRVIDISGDGPNNQGRPVTQARDAAVARGIVINGLPLMTRGGYDAGWGSIEHLDRYYTDCVIGGPGAFMIPVNEWGQFPDAVRRKLVIELAGLWPEPPRREAMRPPAVPAAAGPQTNCRVGEEMWQRRQDR